MFNWKTLVRGDKAYVKGTEVEVCFPSGFMHRFPVYTVRVLGYEKDQYGKDVTTYDVRYRVRDAETVSDSDHDDRILVRADA